jgi:hypothetical protein
MTISLRPNEGSTPIDADCLTAWEGPTYQRRCIYFECDKSLFPSSKLRRCERSMSLAIRGEEEEKPVNKKKQGYGE